MKPTNSRLAVVTASLLTGDHALPCIKSWEACAAYTLPTYIVKGHMGVVPAFAEGVAEAFADGAEAVCCLHDDVLIEQPNWDLAVQYELDHGCKFAGFGGGTSLGADDIYKVPYNPMQLARGGFVSNMQDAEAHGRRSEKVEPCVVFDGFCQIGTKDWFEAAWEWLGKSGIVHHAYDAALGCLAARAKVQPGMMIPVKCHHYGGRTAVGSREYHQWADQQVEGGDQSFWHAAHRIVYDEFRAELPLRLK